MQLKDILKTHSFNGQVLLSKGEQIIDKAAHGYRDIENQIPMTLDTRIRIASVSKQFTAVAMLLLAYQGKCSLDDTLDTYFPHYQHGSKITIHQLLCNSSGIAPYELFADYSTYFAKDYFYEVFVDDVVFPLGLSFEPGTAYEYSGSGYMVLTRLIELISGEPFDVHLKHALFEPLHMKDTDFDHNDPSDHLAVPYDVNEGQIVDAMPIDMRLAGGGGGCFSTVLDLHKWNQSLFDCTLLPQEWINKLFVKYTPINEYVSYGYGFFLASDTNETPPVNYNYHTGGGPGARSISSLFVDYGYQLIMLSNVNDRTTFDKVRSELYQILYQGDIL
ncbi:serine hydrolase domain-containing protein [Candidatus Xianfuyuplasma coldseepsis]|uniref:Serine hydrolase n=1 Tax=Candidatus Xianfuyuplasma coldseepsis TaxID=2782163 RepID=A0A7L7KT11_9MOLU|nr:serine hydrolase [Xianfuyuplasma coldseepsis]QMS85084.1 serine hydrolase [Xianfuyuplasma coldseepsis]